MITPSFIAICGTLVLLVLLLSGIPIAISVALVGIAGLLLVTDVTSTLWAVHSVLFAESFRWVYTVLPMFILLGNFALHADIGADAYNAISKIAGRVRGSLLIATIGACSAMAFACGSSLATSATFTKIALPEMEKRHYDKTVSCGAIASAGTLAVLIPPSIMMVVYCVFTDSSLAKLMIAGILPGLLTATIFMTTLVILLKVHPELAPIISTRVSLKEKIVALRWTGPLFIIIPSILGGIYLGIFTPTEAGAMGATVTFIFLVMRKGLNYRKIFEALLDTIRLSCVIFFVVIGTMFFSRFLVVSGVIEDISTFMIGLDVPRHFILVFILFTYLILGTFMEAVATCALTLPIFFPILMQLGFDETLFGVLVLMMAEIGVITPPLGLNVYVVKEAAGPAVSIEQVFKGIIPYFFAYIISVTILVIFPEIALYLPSLMK